MVNVYMAIIDTFLLCGLMLFPFMMASLIVVGSWPTVKHIIGIGEDV